MEIFKDMIEIGTKAPDFELAGIDNDGNETRYSLVDLLKEGKNIVLYFYPKDNTPGCTTEACDFRDNMNRLTPKSLVVGVSGDSLLSHKKFRDKQGLSFPLLSDPDKEMMNLYGAWGEKSMYGKKFMGVIRATYIIGKDGLVKAVWPKVSVKGHVDDVLKRLDEFL